MTKLKDIKNEIRTMIAAQSEPCIFGFAKNVKGAK